MDSIEKEVSAVATVVVTTVSPLFPSYGKPITIEPQNIIVIYIATLKKLHGRKTT
ncbi:MAG: hypothetical protein ACPMAG_15025 [Limisphaerales bacterium]|jgi:hypothetical protein